MERPENRFQGVATVSFFALDLEKAKEWYSNLLGIDPYFAVPGYVEFRIGDDSVELGIIDANYVGGMPNERPSGAIVYWHVSNFDETAERIRSLGGEVHQAEKNRGNGFVTASFTDPFGNILGIMHNPHYIEIRSIR